MAAGALGRVSVPTGTSGAGASGAEASGAEAGPGAASESESDPKRSSIPGVADGADVGAGTEAPSPVGGTEAATDEATDDSSAEGAAGASDGAAPSGASGAAAEALSADIGVRKKAAMVESPKGLDVRTSRSGRDREEIRNSSDILKLEIHQTF